MSVAGSSCRSAVTQDGPDAGAAGLVCRQNRLLMTLPAVDRERIATMLEPVYLRRGIHLEPGPQARHAYFPVTAMVALLQVADDGSAVEVASVGNDGMIGAERLSGSGAGRLRALVTGDGRAYRIGIDFLAREFARGGALQRIVLGYLQVLLAQVAQTAVCNRRHSLRQQVCRWLLMSLDSLSSSEVLATQEGIADLLGVRREGVNVVARQLKAGGLIAYGSGWISVIERSGLEALACECYGLLRRARAQWFDADVSDRGGPSVRPASGHEIGSPALTRHEEPV